MARRVGCLLAALSFVGCTGCFVYLPSDFLSGFVLNPDTTCEQLRVFLDLGELPPASTPTDIGLQYEAFTVTSANGRQLVGWLIPAQWQGELDAEPLGTMLFMHGTDGNIACTLPWALVASANHMHAVVFDYQGFGDSEGTADIVTLLDDSDAVLNWIIADASPARQQVHLVGTSLGTSAALGLVTLRNQPQIRSVTLDGAWDPEAMVGGLGSSVSPLFPLFDFSARTDFAWLFQMRAGLGDVTTPAMFIHGEVDDITPLTGARTMRDLLGSSAKSFFVFEGLNHIQPLFRNRQAYISLLVTVWRDPSATPSGTAWISDSTIRLPEFTP